MTKFTRTFFVGVSVAVLSVVLLWAQTRVQIATPNQQTGYSVGFAYSDTANPTTGPLYNGEPNIVLNGGADGGPIVRIYDGINAAWQHIAGEYGAGEFIVFEGATADAFETTLTVVDPTGDTTIALPSDNATWAGTGYVVVSNLATNAPDAANSIWGESNSLHFEGATANDFENALQSANPVVSDANFLMPNNDAEGAGPNIYSLIFSILDTNALDVADSVWFEANDIWFEGATANAFEIVITAEDATVGVQNQLIPDRAVADSFYFTTTHDGEITASQFFLPTQAGLPADAAAAAEDALAADLDMVCYRAFLPYPMTLTEATIYEYAVGAGAGTYMGLGVYEDDDAGALLSVGSTVYAADGAALVVDMTDVDLFPGWYRWCGCQQTVANQDWLGIAQTAVVTAVYNETVSELRYGQGADCTGNAVAPAATGALASTAESMFVAHFTTQ
jgi:hypothetical protein